MFILFQSYVNSYDPSTEPGKIAKCFGKLIYSCGNLQIANFGYVVNVIVCNGIMAAIVLVIFKICGYEPADHWSTKNITLAPLPDWTVFFGKPLDFRIRLKIGCLFFYIEFKPNHIHPF